MSVYILPRVTGSYTWHKPNPYVGDHIDHTGRPEAHVHLASRYAIVSHHSRYSNNYYVGTSEYAYAGIPEYSDGRTASPISANYISVVSWDVYPTTPAWTSTTEWRYWSSSDGAITFPLIWDGSGPFYTNNTPGYVPVLPSMGYNSNGLGDPEAYVQSETAIWLFQRYSYGNNGNVAYSYRIWNRTTNALSAETLLPALTPVNGNSATNLRVLEPPTGDLLYLVYQVSGTACVRTLDRVSKVLSGVLHSFSVPGANGDALGPRGVCGNKIFTVGTGNYFLGWFGDGSVAIYKFDTSTPSTITAVTGTGWVNDRQGLASFEYDPVGPTLNAVYWRVGGGASAATTLTRSTANMLAASWASATVAVSDMPSDSWSDPDTFLAFVIGSVTGGATHSTLFYSTRELVGAAFAPSEVSLRVKCWNDPTLHDASVVVDASSSFDVALAPSGSVVVSVEVGNLQSSVAASFNSTVYSIVNSRWRLIANSFVDADLYVDLSLMDSTVNASLGGFIDAIISIDVGYELSITIVPDNSVFFTMEQSYVMMGTSWLGDFHALVNAERVALGLGPYKTWGTDLSLNRALRVDIAQVHATDIARTGIYQHDSSSFPEGWQSIAERLSRATQLGGAENTLATRAFKLSTNALTPVTPADAFTQWWNSPGHRANMLHDWGPEYNSSIYSTMGLDWGLPYTSSPYGPATDPATDYRYIYLNNNFIVFLEVTVEFEFGQSWEFTGATVSILDSGWTNSAYTNAKLWQASNYGLAVSASHEAQYTARVAQQHVVPTYYTVLGLLDAPYSPTIKIVPAVHSAGYAIRLEVSRAQFEAGYSLRVVSSHELQYTQPTKTRSSHEALYEPSPKASAALISEYESMARASTAYEAQYESMALAKVAYEAQYESMARVRSSFSAEYEPNPSIGASFLALYEPMVKAYASFEAPYEQATSVQAAMSSSYTGLVPARSEFTIPSVMPSPVRAINDSGYEISILNKIKAICDSRYALSTAGVEVGNTAVILTHKGKSLRLDNAYISSGRGDSGYRFEAVINDIEMYRSMVELDTLAVDFAGESYSFVIVGMSMNRSSPQSVQASISALSPVYLQDLPYAPQISYVPSGAELLSTIVAEVMGAPVAWEVPDWVVPFGRAQIAEATRLQAANSLLGSIAATIQSNPDGSLVARYTYPTNWDVVQLTAPAHTFDDAQDILAVSSSYEYRKGYNRYHLRDSDSSYGDSIDWIKDENNSLTGIAKVTPYPYRTSWSLSTTSEEPLTIEDLGEVVETLTEMVEFVSGVGTLSRPIISLTSLSWASSSLGGVSFNPYSTRLTAPTSLQDGYGLAKVVYTSKAFQFQVTALTPIESAQLIVKEN